MPLNSAGSSFIPLGGPFALPPTIMMPSRYSGLTSEACSAAGLTGIAVNGTQATILTASILKTLRLIVPTDQPPVCVANEGDLTTGTTGFTILSGVGIVLSPYNDPVVALTPSGLNSTIYYSTET